MNIFSRIKTFLKQETEEQIVGYSVPELKSVFAKASLPRNSFLLPPGTNSAQAYYNDNYFHPFFTELSDLERLAYYARFEATDEWIKALDLMYDVE
ncbi:MAG: hypothetical protein U1A73_18710 [Pseudomonas sp.]|nr:hypothetical protein [Pseudomonas sp.]